MASNKTCSKCGFIGDSVLFRNKSNTCKKCYGNYSKELRLKNIDRNRKLKREWNRNNRHKIKEYSRNATVKKYGLTVDLYEKHLSLQNNACFICKRAFDTSSPCIDHCHSTGKFRSLLCNSCNSLIGYCNERVDILESAIQYIRNVVNPTLLAEEATKAYYQLQRDTYNK